jgi:metalloendopeptidase OMA1, mitochondrial
VSTNIMLRSAVWRPQISTSLHGTLTRLSASTTASKNPTIQRQFSSSSTRRLPLPPYRKNSGSGIPTYVWLGAFVPTAGGAYIYYKYLDEVPLTHRKRWIATSTAWERRAGDQEYQQLLKQFRGKVLPKDHRASVTVHRVGSRIAKAAEIFCQQHHMEDFFKANSPPTFTVVRSDMANAFVLPNNHIFVMTGLFQFVHDEDDLAAVLGHEMAHNLARHVGEKVSGSVVISILARLSLLLDPSGALLTVILPASSLLRELPHSRTQESEADQIGIHLAAQACYDPRSAKRVFQAMKEASSKSNSQSPPEFLSTHPSHETRIQNFDQWMDSALKTYKEDGGERCRKIRQEMTAARQMAAQQATQREHATATSRPRPEQPF